MPISILIAYEYLNSFKLGLNFSILMLLHKISYDIFFCHFSFFFQFHMQLKNINNA